MIDIDFTIIGAGVIGLAIARELSINKKKVLIIESQKTFGTSNSSRNSGVIHAGIYYKKNSFKSRFCLEGNKFLYKYAESRNIKVNKCGKIIVSNNSNEEQKLLEIYKNARECGVKLKYLDAKQIRKIEPNLNSYCGLLSNSSGVIDVYNLMLNYITDIENNNGIISYNTNFLSAKIKDSEIQVITNQNKKEKFFTKFLINAGGLNSEVIAKKIKGERNYEIPRIIFIRGNYFKLNGKNPFKRLVYPIPNNRGLGIHSTNTVNNETLFGPDDEIIKKISFLNTNKVSLKEKFFRLIKLYWNDIDIKKINYDFSGIRTKLYTNKHHDFLIQDYNSHGYKNLINLFGFDSPGITASYSIGKYVNRKVDEILKL